LKRSWSYSRVYVAVIAGVALCLAAVNAVPAKGATQTPWTVAAVLRQMDAQAKNFSSLTADIERTKVTVVVNDKSTESGKIFVRRDGKMRMEVTSPDARTILLTGDSLFIFNPKINQVAEYNIGKHKEMADQFLLLGFGTSGDALQNGYAITLQNEDSLDGRKVLMLELTPKSADMLNQISKIQIWLDEATWLPAQQKFFETGSGDYFTVRYTNVVRNVRISDEQFRPHWPAGATKIKPEG
jgi:outer membrane lipoprotein-sorting protein